MNLAFTKKKAENLPEFLSEIKRWYQDMTHMGHVTYIIMSGIAMEYLGPNMTPTRRHVTQKNKIFCQKMASKRKFGQNTST